MDAGLDYEAPNGSQRKLIKLDYRQTGALFVIVNEIRALQGQPAPTKAQFSTWLQSRGELTKDQFKEIVKGT